MKICEIITELNEAPKNLPVFFDFCEFTPSQIINSRLDLVLSIGFNNAKRVIPPPVETVLREIKIGLKIIENNQGKSVKDDFLYVGKDNINFKTVITKITVLNKMVIMHTAAIYKNNPNRFI